MRCGIGLAVLFSVSVAGAGAEVTPPVPLCEEALTLGVDLRRYTAAEGWQAADPGAAVVVELGGGLYYVDGLPDPAGSERYQVHLVSEVSGLILATYAWGARPGERLVWRHDVVFPAQPRVFKTGDSYGSIELEVRSGLTAAIAEPSTAVTFRLYSPAADGLVVADQPALVTDVVADQTTMSYGATLVYELAVGDLDVPGRLVGEFRVCYVAGCHTLPADDSLTVEVVPRLGGEP